MERSAAGARRYAVVAEEARDRTDRGPSRVAHTASGGEKIRTVVVEDHDVGRKRVVRSEAGRVAVVAHAVIAFTRQAGAGLQHIGFEIVLVADESDIGGEIQSLCENFDLESLRYDDVFAVAGVVVNAFPGAILVHPIGARKRRSGREAGERQRHRCGKCRVL
jgi:hypothetical protein